MPDILQEIYKDRLSLAETMKKHKGIRTIVEDLYPDSAHFIYELLQNAEDTHATEACFSLEKERLIFEHNGRDFTETDIWAITDIGEGTKRNDDDKIGRFGVGFKAVFAYSETPHVYSPTFSFRIEALVLPTTIAGDATLNGKTRFIFPFNNPKKKSETAYEEIKLGLKELEHNTLLFLKNLNSINWHTAEQHCQIKRIQHSEQLIEILKQETTTTSSEYFLRFTESINGLPNQQVAIAFPLSPRENIVAITNTTILNIQFKISLAMPSVVAVFFPAKKETSGLHFHLHAPFIPELSRASIKDTPANRGLYALLAKLCGDSLPKIREMGLLDASFLEVLPNMNDEIPPAYSNIRSEIINAFNTQKITPTFNKTYDTANSLLQAESDLKNLLTTKDLKRMIPNGLINKPNWVINTMRNSRADKFLSNLKLSTWKNDNFIEFLQTNENNTINWLKTKEGSIEWHKKFYALLSLDNTQNKNRYNTQSYAVILANIPLILTTDLQYMRGSECYFKSQNEQPGYALTFAHPDLYKDANPVIKKTLTTLGVREVNEEALIENILNMRYTAYNLAPNKNDLPRFINFIEKHPNRANLFAEYFIFYLGNNEDKNTYGKASQTYVDLPIYETGLDAYYLTEIITNKRWKWILTEEEIKTLGQEKLINFAQELGVAVNLPLEKVSVLYETENRAQYIYPGYAWADKRHLRNKEWAEFQVTRGTTTEHATDYNWKIASLEQLLQAPSEQLSFALWRLLIKTGQERKAYYDNKIIARYSPNARAATQSAPASWIVLLIFFKWIPQEINNQLQFVIPADASVELLPTKFKTLFSSHNEGIEAIKFSQSIEQEKQNAIQNDIAEQEKQQSKEKAAKELGFASADEATELANCSSEERTEMRAEIRNRKKQKEQRQEDLPQHDSNNPVRRAERVREHAKNAEDKNYEQRSRSVSTNEKEPKAEAKKYLTHQYTNDKHEMFCQICQTPLPFKLENGEYYVEIVQLVENTNKHFYQNYLALCPNHSAMFKHANMGKNSLPEKIITNTEHSNISILLANKPCDIYFTNTHMGDLQTILHMIKKEEDL